MKHQWTVINTYIWILIFYCTCSSHWNQETYGKIANADVSAGRPLPFIPSPITNWCTAALAMPYPNIPEATRKKLISNYSCMSWCKMMLNKIGFCKYFWDLLYNMYRVPNHNAVQYNFGCQHFFSYMNLGKGTNKYFFNFVT